MKKILLSACIFLFTSTQAQDVINSRTGSYFNFIYKITNEEARTLYRNEDHPLSKEFFHTLVDFYPNDSLYRKKLETGHYLFVYSSGSSFHGELESVNNLEMVIL